MVSDRLPRCEAIDENTRRKYMGVPVPGGDVFAVTAIGMARCMYAAGHPGGHKNPDGQEWR